MPSSSTLSGSGAQLLVQCLVAQGVRKIFCVPGESHLGVIDALYDVREKISLVVRVMLKADGTLSAPPTLIEASASPKGPLLLQNLLRGLTQCQPYNMLPADKYQEWKNLDMRFTPADMGQG